MLKPEFFDELTQKLVDAMPENIKAARADMEKHFRHIIQAMFAKMDLITREEFDIQVLVLSKTRAKLEKLEQKLVLLEKEREREDKKA